MAKVWTDDGLNETQDFQKTSSARDQIKQIREKSKGFGPNFESQMGLCAHCQHLMYVVNDVYQLIYTQCRVYQLGLGRHKVKDCSEYKSKNELSLMQMYEMATLIDPKTIKDKPGFITKEGEVSKDA